MTCQNNVLLLQSALLLCGSHGSAGTGLFACCFGGQAESKGKKFEQVGAFMSTTSSMKVEVAAISAALRWLSGTRAIIVTDCQSILHTT